MKDKYCRKITIGMTKLAGDADDFDFLLQPDIDKRLAFLKKVKKEGIYFSLDKRGKKKLRRNYFNEMTLKGYWPIIPTLYKDKDTVIYLHYEKPLEEKK